MTKIKIVLEKPATFLSILLILVAIVSIYYAASPNSISNLNSDLTFPTKNAYAHLLKIAQKPHSIGTIENKKVHDYIISECNRIGLSTFNQNAIATARYSTGISAANVNNIIAILKGQKSTNRVIVVAHYDSQPNSIGAGDDGANCAAMLAVAETLKNKQILNNDVLFLFTDGEENDLMGARAFVNKSEFFKPDDIVLNFEGRGNKGTSAMFETNSLNGWVLKGYINSKVHRKANSLNYEIYRILGNSTDYTVFKAVGLTGLNNAYVGGFNVYHCMTDTPDEMDRNTFQEQGENMLELINYFGNVDIKNTKSPDLTFFNLISNIFIHYDSSLNFAFILLADFLFVLYLLFGFRSKQLSTPKFLLGFILFAGFLFSLYSFTSWVLSLARIKFPLYQNYYPNSYNTQYIFFIIVVFNVIIFIIIYQYLLRKLALISLNSGILFFLVLITNCIYIYLPSATYVTLFPVLFQLFYYFLNLNVNFKNRSRIMPILAFLLLLPSIFILSPIIYFLYLAFGLLPQASFGIIILWILLGLLLPILSLQIAEFRWFFPAIGSLLIIISFALSLQNAGYTREHPFKTNLRYSIDDDAKKAFWSSDLNKMDIWTSQFLKDNQIKYAMGAFQSERVSLAKMISYTPPSFELIKDSVNSNIRKVTLLFKTNIESTSLLIKMDENSLAKEIEINEDSSIQPTSINNEYSWFNFSGLTSKGVILTFYVDPKKPFGIEVMEKSLGLPNIDGFNAYPSNVIPGPGDLSNTTIIGKHISLK